MKTEKLKPNDLEDKLASAAGIARFLFVIGIPFLCFLIGMSAMWLWFKIDFINRPEPAFIHWPNLVALFIVLSAMCFMLWRLTKESKK